MYDKRTAFAVTRGISFNKACLAMISVNLVWVVFALFVIGGLPLVLMAALGFHFWLLRLEMRLETAQKPGQEGTTAE